VRAFAAHNFRQLVLFIHLKTRQAIINTNKTVNRIKGIGKHSKKPVLDLKSAAVDRRLNHLQGKALGNLERVFLGAPVTLEDCIPHDVDGVSAT